MTKGLCSSSVIVLLSSSAQKIQLRLEFELFFYHVPMRPRGKDSACQCKGCRRRGSHLCVGKSSWNRKWHPLQHSCLENPVDRGAWQATVHQITKSQRQLKRLSTHARRRKVLNTNVFLNAATPSSLYTAQNPAVFYISQSLILILWN